jgi:hypothetical protein
LGTQIVLTFLNPRNKSRKKAGIPIITLKLNGGIASIATLNKDHTEVQTKIKRIKRKIGKNCFEKFNPICSLIFSK